MTPQRAKVLISPARNTILKTWDTSSWCKQKHKCYVSVKHAVNVIAFLQREVGVLARNADL